MNDPSLEIDGVDGELARISDDAAMEPVLEVHEIVKRYKSLTAVSGLSFSVRRGEIFALLGPNGAGKTTIVRMLANILRPDAGSITWNLGAGSWPAPEEIGYLPEDRGLYRELPVLRTLTYFGALRGMAPREARSAAERWLDRLSLGDRASDKLDALSKGNQLRLHLPQSDYVGFPAEPPKGAPEPAGFPRPQTWICPLQGREVRFCRRGHPRLFRSPRHQRSNPKARKRDPGSQKSAH